MLYYSVPHWEFDIMFGFFFMILLVYSGGLVASHSPAPFSSFEFKAASIVAVDFQVFRPPVLVMSSFVLVSVLVLSCPFPLLSSLPYPSPLTVYLRYLLEHG